MPRKFKNKVKCSYPDQVSMDGLVRWPVWVLDMDIILNFSYLFDHFRKLADVVQNPVNHRSWGIESSKHKSVKMRPQLLRRQDLSSIFITHFQQNCRKIIISNKRQQRGTFRWRPWSYRWYWKYLRSGTQATKTWYLASKIQRKD